VTEFESSSRLVFDFGVPTALFASLSASPQLDERAVRDPLHRSAMIAFPVPPLLPNGNTNGDLDFFSFHGCSPENDCFGAD